MTNPTLPEGAEQAPDDNPNRIVNPQGELVAGPMPTSRQQAVPAETDWQALIATVPVTELATYLENNDHIRRSILGNLEHRPEQPPTASFVNPASATGR